MTSTLAAPAVPAGVVQVIEVAVLALSAVQAAPPILTALALVRVVPVMVTLVPPAVGPLLGLMAVTVGGPTKMTNGQCWAESSTLVPHNRVVR